jgi:undecaprenyl pyrophosphate phosphatase UppP
MPLAYVLVTLIFVIIIGWIVNSYITVPPNIKTIVNIVLGLIVVGMGLWLINTYVPMAGSIKAILNIVVVLATCVGVLQAFGLWSRVVGLWHDFIGRFHGDHTHISTP